MEDKEISVDIVAEPKIDRRFGIQMDRKPQSSTAIVIGVIATVTALGMVLMIKAPEKKEHKEVSAPESSQINSFTSNQNFESYSAAIESKKIKSQSKKPKTSAIAVQLPGLQRLDRKRAEGIPPGSILKAQLVTRASNGPVRAEVKESLQVQGETLIPIGTILLGSGESSEDRLIVQFRQIIFKDGSFENIQAQAADIEDRMAGLRASRMGSYALKYGAAIGLHFVSGMADGFREQDVIGQEVINRPNAKNAFLNGAGRATLELAQDTMSEIKNKPPSLEVPAGKEILVIFE